MRSAQRKLAIVFNRPHNPGPCDDDWETTPYRSDASKYAAGLLLPAAFATYAVIVFVTNHGILPSRGHTMHLHGPNAIAYAVSLASIALFLHFHYFWGNIHDQHPLAVLGKILSLLTFIPSTFFLIWRTFTKGF